ncbi:MAG: hypothetical protein SH856_04000 [Flavobacteriales bacterium]|nr:hypothetical protein [Flavobacteriales bacterium]
MLSAAKTVFLGFTLIFLSAVIAFLLSNQSLTSLVSLLDNYFDAAHYRHIRDNGYHDFRVAFFPALPFVWRVLQFSSLGISFFNILCYFISLLCLVRVLHPFRSDILLLMILLPSSLFFFIPYTESLFFLSLTLVIVGKYKRLLWLECFGLFAASLVRPTAFILIPAIIAAEFFTHNKESNAIKRIPVLVASVLIGLGTVFFIHSLDTGEWFAFFDAQRDWGNEFRFPFLPLSSWSSFSVVALDSIALWISLVSVGFIISRLKHGFGGEGKEKQMVLFSLTYLAVTGIFILFTRGGSLFSLNRFIFCVPLLYFFLQELSRLKFKQFAIVLMSYLPFSLFMGSYLHVKAFFHYSIVGGILFLLCFFLINTESRFKQGKLILAISIGLILNCYFWLRLFENEWIG